MVSEDLADFVKKCGANLPSAFLHLKNGAKGEWNQAFDAFIQKLDLVTREEFEAQVRVLARMQDKVKWLEEKIIFLETALEHHSE